MYSYLISASLHVLLLTVMALSSSSWIFHSPEQDAMVVDMVMVDKIDDKGGQNPELKEKTGKLSELKKDIAVNGDTALMSKDDQVFAKPIPATEKGELEEVKKEGAEVASSAVQAPAIVEESKEKPADSAPIVAEEPKVEPTPKPAEQPVEKVAKEEVTQEVTKSQPAPVVKPAPQPTKAVPNAAKEQKAVSPMPQKRRERPDDKMDKVLKAVKQYRQEALAAREGPNSTEGDGRLAAHLAQYVQNQIVQCWNIPVAASDADIKIHIKATLDASGNVTDITVLHKMQDSPLYEAIESSAIRAIRQCSPLTGLPTDKYYLWSSLSLVFDPKKAGYY